MHQPAVAAVHFHGQGEGRFRGPFKNGLLGAAAAGFLIAQGDRLDAAHQVAEGGVLDQIGQLIAMGGRHQHHAPLGNGARRLGLQLGPDLINDDDLGHVVFDGLDHHLVLQLRPGHLHPARPSDRGVRDVPIPGDLVAGVDHHDPLLQLIGENPGDFAQGGRLADAGASHQQEGLTAIHQVAHHGHGAEDRPPDPAGQSNDIAAAVANGADAVQGPLNPSAVVASKGAELGDDGGQVAAFHGGFPEGDGASRVAGLGDPAQIQYDLEQLVAGLRRSQGLPDGLGKDLEQPIEVVGDALRA